MHSPLYGQSYLRDKKTGLAHMVELAEYLSETEPTKLIFKRGYVQQSDCIIDVAEKIGFLYLAMDYVEQMEGKGRYFKLVKYHLYNMIYIAKACLDSLAVLLNLQLKLGFAGAERDFRNRRFVKKLESSCPHFHGFWSKYGRWIEKLIDYRDSLIHRKGILVYTRSFGPPDGQRPPPTAKNYMTLEPLSLNELLTMLRAGKELDADIKDMLVEDFCKEILDNAKEITETTLFAILDSLKKQHTG